MRNTMHASELRTKSPDELQQLLEEKRRDIDNVKFSLYQKKTKNVKEVKFMKKDVARILGVLREGTV